MSSALVRFERNGLAMHSNVIPIYSHGNKMRLPARITTYTLHTIRKMNHYQLIPVLFSGQVENLIHVLLVFILCWCCLFCYI